MSKPSTLPTDAFADPHNNPGHFAQVMRDAAYRVNHDLDRKVKKARGILAADILEQECVQAFLQEELAAVP